MWSLLSWILTNQGQKGTCSLNKLLLKCYFSETALDVENTDMKKTPPLSKNRSRSASQRIDIYMSVNSVQFSHSVMSNSLQPCELQHARPPCPSPTPRVHPPMSIESVMPSNHLILCRPLLLLPPIFPSIRVFSDESALCIRWPEYWSFSFNISPSNEHPGLISSRMDWLDLLAVQGTLKSLLQNHSSKAMFLQRSAFFIVQLSHPYMTTGKTIALTRRTFLTK